MGDLARIPRDRPDVADMRLIDRRTDDGSRHFTSLPEGSSWYALRAHILLLRGAEIANFIVEGVAEPWLDFTYHDHRFSVRREGGQLGFFVRDPQCPDVTLYEVASHCERLLGSPPAE